MIGITDRVRRPLYNLPISTYMDVTAQKESRMRWPAKMAVVVGYIGLIALMTTAASSQMAVSEVSPCPDRTTSQAIQQDAATDHPACTQVDVIPIDEGLQLFEDAPWRPFTIKSSSKTVAFYR